MTTRSSPDSVYGSSSSKVTYNNGTSEVQSTSVSTAKWINTVTYGDNLRDWRDLLQRGDDATTSLSGTRVDARFTPGYLKVSQPKTGNAFGINFYEVSGTHLVNFVVPSGDPSTIDSAKADNLALGKFARRITDINNAIKGGIVLGELAQTLHTIRNPARGLRRLVDDWGYTAKRIRASRTSGVRSLPYRIKTIRENLADAWLEAQYGWRPLMSDIQAGFLALHQYKLGQVGKTKRITAHGTTEANSQETTDGNGESIAIWRVGTVSVEHCEVIYRGAMRLEARDPRTLDSEHLGFNLGSFIPTAWELAPWSFLIDYFSNIGDVVNGWSTLFTRLAWCNRTVRKERRVTSVSRSSIELVRKTFPLVTGVAIAPAKSVFSKRSISRAKYTGTYVPGLVLEVPGFGSLKWLNIAALIAAQKGDRNWSFGD
jgi:hypothetical protein